MSLVSLSLPAPLVKVLHKLLPSLPPTKRDSDVPPLYREPFILSGYRPVGLSWTHYILSLLQIHNDTVKIWCHLLAALFVATRVLFFIVLHGGGVLGVQLQGADGVGLSVDPCSLPLLLCVLSTVSCLICSVTALLLHPRSEPVRLSLLLLDSGARGVHQFGRALALNLYSSDGDWTTSTVGQLYLPTAAILAWLSCFTGCCAELFPHRSNFIHRRLLQRGLMSLAFLLDLSPVAQRLYTCPWSSSTAVLLHGLQVVLFLTVAFFLFCPVPECLSPGRFDIVGHSGQLSLVLLTLSTVSQQEALLQDFSWRRAGVVRRFGEEYLLKACAGFTAVTLSCSATALALRRCKLAK